MRGDFRGRDRLPSEHEIAVAFNVNRHTVRQALAALVERGVVIKRKGGGSYLVPGVIDYAIGGRTRFSANLLLQEREPAHRILEMREIAAEPRIAHALDLQPGAEVAFMSTIGEADSVPISIGQHYIPSDRFPNFLDAYRREMSMTKVFRQFGVADYRRKLTRVIAALPTETDAKLLQQGRHAPVLAVESLDTDLADKPITFHEIRFAGERVQFVLGEE